MPHLKDLESVEPKIIETMYKTSVVLISCFDSLEKNEFGCNGTFKHLSALRGSVLVFLPGIEEIYTMMKRMIEFATKTRDSMHWKILQLHSEMSTEEQLCVLKPPSYVSEEATHTRKIIFSTSIAENSLTIPDIKYVVDFCLDKTFVSQSHTKNSSLKVVSNLLNRIYFYFFILILQTF